MLAVPKRLALGALLVAALLTGFSAAVAPRPAQAQAACLTGDYYYGPGGFARIDRVNYYGRAVNMDLTLVPNYDTAPYRGAPIYFRELRDGTFVRGGRIDDYYVRNANGTYSGETRSWPPGTSVEVQYTWTNNSSNFIVVVNCTY
jgi:hypothetical protein